MLIFVWTVNFYKMQISIKKKKLISPFRMKPMCDINSGKNKGIKVIVVNNTCYGRLIDTEMIIARESFSGYIYDICSKAL